MKNLHPPSAVVFFSPSLTCHRLLSFSSTSNTVIPGGMSLKKMLEANELNNKVTAQAKKNRAMENTMNTRENALLLVANQVEDYDDLLMIQAETGLEMAELETIYYSII